MGQMAVRAEFVTEIAELLRRYGHGETDHRSVDRLVLVAAEIVRRRFFDRLMASARFQDISLQQLSISLVAGLFTGLDPLLRDAIRDKLASDGFPLFNQFRTIVTRFAFQEIFHRWREYDPVSPKIWRAMICTLRHSPQITVFPAGSPKYASLASVGELKIDHQKVEYCDIVGIITREGLAHIEIREMIIAILAAVAESTSTQRAVAIATLFAAIRDTCTNLAGAELSLDFLSCEIDPDMRIDIDRAIGQSLAHIELQINKYQRTGKLDIAICESFRKAIASILADCAAADPHPDYFAHLEIQFSGLTEEQYRDHYRSKFEYLAGLARDYFAEYFGGKL